MGKLPLIIFPTPEYVENAIQKIIDSPEIQALINKSEPKESERQNNQAETEETERIFFRLWLIDQFERYPKVLKATKSYLKANKKILPPEPNDFMRWFVKYVKKTSDNYRAVKIMDYHFHLFHKERSKLMGNDLLLRTFNTSYTPSQLKTIRKNLITEKIISNITEDDFLYLFTGLPIKENMTQLNWKKSVSFAHFFLSKVVYCGVNFDTKQVKQCITFPDGKELDSNSKSRSQYKNEEILQRILDV